MYSENEICIHSIHVKSFDGDVRVFCVDCMSSCAHRQLGFRNHYPSKHCLTRPTQQTSDYMDESPTPHFICLHLIVQSQMCSINILHGPKAADAHTVSHSQDEEWKKNPQAEWAQNGILEWEVGNFFLLFPMDLVFLVIRRAFLTAGFHLDPAALCVLFVGSWVWTQVFIPPSPLSQGQTIKTGLYWGEQWWGVTAHETSKQGRSFGLHIGGVEMDQS